MGISAPLGPGTQGKSQNQSQGFPLVGVWCSGRARLRGELGRGVSRRVSRASYRAPFPVGVLFPVGSPSSVLKPEQVGCPCRGPADAS